ncbi:hypothetical protein V8F20_010725 [Naviculisporaceae sp. PSN 640]
MTRTKRNLLICFDAFGTLFKPNRPVDEQYTAVARKFGVGLNPDGTSTFNSADVAGSFRNAFKQSAKEYPNYGRAVGMGAKAWWTKVIHDTFIPLLPPSQQGKPLPQGLAPALLHRFQSSEGYHEPSPGLKPLFHRLKSLSSQTNTEKQTAAPFDNVVVGVITNSDDRVPDILSDFGLRVSPLRYGTDVGESLSRTASSTITRTAKEEPASGNDIDFHCISYDVGYEKPDKRIFEAAEGMVGRVIPSSTSLNGSLDTKDWIKVFVGDEYRHDVVGAMAAGWVPVWIPEMDGKVGEGNIVARPDGHYDVDVEGEIVMMDKSTIKDVKWGNIFGSRRVVVKCSSLEVLVDWLASLR